MSTNTNSNFFVFVFLSSKKIKTLWVKVIVFDLLAEVIVCSCLTRFLKCAWSTLSLAFEISPLCCFTRLILFCFVIGGAVRALNSIFQKWNLTADTKQWNTTGDPCSGLAVDEDDETGYFYNEYNDYNPFVKCNCSYDTNSTCHITQL